jgi:ABC-type spermidine/putrescine transport system permease subunit I
MSDVALDFVSRPTVRAWRARPRLMILGVLAFYGLVYCLPMAVLLGWAFRGTAGDWTLANLVHLASDATYYIVFAKTFRMAIVTTVICAIIGYPYAFLLATCGPVARAILGAAIMIPFWTSVLARSLAWVILLGRRGVINDWLTSLGVVDQPMQLLFNSIGVQIGMVHVLLPFMVLPIWSILARLDTGLPMAARSLGASPVRAFVHVVLPLSMPGVAAGATLVFMLAVGFYITPALLGGPQDVTIATLIDTVVRDLLDWPFGATISLTLVAIVGAIFAIGSAIAGTGRIAGLEDR